MKTITWLHLSDLHLCNPETGWESQNILDTLKKDLQKMENDYGLRPDLIFFTGDIAYGQLGNEDGKSIKSQFEEAERLFSEIRQAFTPSVSQENFFIVPGNHDVNRKKVNKYQHNGFEEELTGDYQAIEKKLSNLINKADQDWNDFAVRLSDYKQFLKEFEYNHLLEYPERLIYAVNREINGIKLGIAGFNSAWSCWQDKEKGRIWLAGHWQIQNLHNKLKSADMKIGIMHHPINWFTQVEDPNIKVELENNFTFFLHGHEHQNWIDEKSNGFTRIAAGACYGDSPQETGYNFVRLNFDKSKGENKGEVWMRKYEKDTQEWEPKKVKGSDNNGLKLIETFQNCLPEHIFEPKPEIPAPPKHKTHIKPEPLPPKKPKSENINNTPESRGIFGRGKKITEISKALKNNSIILVFGMPGIGKSVLITEVRKNCSDQLPKSTNFRVDSNTRYPDLFRQMARILGCNDEKPAAPPKLFGKIDFSPLQKYAKRSSPGFIYIEDVHNLFTDKNLINQDIDEFMAAISKFYPETRIVMESRIKPAPGIFHETSVKYFKITGLDKDSMALFFERPFIKFPNKGWILNDNEKDYVFERLGGSKKSKNFAHPLAMNLLAIVADGLKQSPVQVLNRHKDKLLKDLEDSLFTDLYDNVLGAADQHLLRICSIYRGDFPFSHIDGLNKGVKASDVFTPLVNRCLLTPDENEEWYSLHSLISELTQKRIDQDKDEFLLNHDLIASLWLSQLEISSYPNLPNSKIANEALFHLVEAGNYAKFYEISEKLLSNNVIPYLENSSRQLYAKKKFIDNEHVLELIIRLDPENHKAHRFLGQQIERIKGKGNQEALDHYWKAYKYNPTFPPYLNNLGTCLLARNTPKIFIQEVQNMDKEDYEKVMNSHNFAVYTRCLSAVGENEKASKLRMNIIESGTKNPVFYNDEADYLLKAGKYEEALLIIERAEKAGASNDFIISVKAKIFEQTGELEKASKLRMNIIESGTKDSVFYNDEADYLLKAGKYEQALLIIERAEKAGASDDFIMSVKAKILEQTGEHEKASKLRMNMIESGKTHAAFYNDEADYLLKAGKYEQAILIIERAEKAKCTDEYTVSIKAKILEKSKIF